MWPLQTTCTLFWAILFIISNNSADATLSIDSRENIWVTWAQQTNQTDLCLSLNQANNPFRTCLIGYPYFQWQDWKNFTTVNRTTIQIALKNWKTNNHVKCITNLTSTQNAFELFLVLSNLTQNAILPLQELDLMGSFSPYGPLVNFTEKYNCSPSYSLDADNGTGAVLFNVRYAFDNPAFYRLKQAVSASRSGQWSNASLTYGTEEVTTLGNFRFPLGYFLICGDRAWPGIPENPWGGPCYVGKLTMFTPTYRNLITNAYNCTHFKRTIHGIGPDCNSRVEISSIGAAVTMSFFVPGVMAALIGVTSKISLVSQSKSSMLPLTS
ncbi:uncharacterized protein LOC126638605 [Myiozetetes cayanensis]|uniref:uncharacterized protein LOC126638605 n=1 Tax=Myiozetetes cayanensis TaxID=478635 RepID=UPI00215F2423|nr:uncharacterized protein LOC126638605 [Myiozetetes cayanensis]